MKKKMKCLLAFVLVVISVMMCAIPASADHYYPDGGSVYGNLTDKVDLNRTIYVYHKTSSGQLLKYCEYKTGVIGDYDVFGDTIYGYDIIGYKSNQGIGEHCKMTWAAGNDSTGAYGQVGYEFYALISKKSLTINFTYELHDPTTFNIRHYIIDEDGYKSLYSTSTETHSYGDTLNIRKKTITGYSLDSEYLSSITGEFTYDIVKASKNISERLYYDHVHGSKNGEMYRWNSYQESSDEYICYCKDREINVDFVYRIKSYSVKYDANGGSGTPDEQTKYYGIDIDLSDTVPTRNGYTFKGWGTYASDTTPNYQPGDTYTSNSGRTLYAIWESNTPSSYTVSYNANGGSGAPASQTKTHNVSLTLSSTKPTRSGYTFMGWSTSSSATSASYSAGGSYTTNASATMYAVWNKNSTPTPPPTPTYTVSYNANGGSGAPASQTKTQNVTLTLSSTEPYRSGYTFLGWSTSSSASYPTYYAGGSYTANASATLYAVWEQNAPESYTVRYNANGGSGAPSSQTKTEDVSLRLSYTEPYRSGYDFKGWATSSSATSATYQPGDTYTANASVTLYAVWDETNYDFSISNLTVSDSNPYKYGQVTVKVRTDSWDQVNAYSDIPVQLYYDGSLVGTQYVDFSVYGVANVTFTLNVGSGIGNKTIEARINWADHYSETRTGNNTVSTSIEVKDYNYEMSAGETSSSAGYAEGETVITSFTVRNDSEHDIIPSSRNNVLFTAYYYNGSQKVVITTQRKNNLVIPSGGANLVYFKWTVPDGLAGKTVYCECTVNADRYLNEENYSNNTVTASTTVISFADSQTANTRYESSQPSSYRDVAEPNANTGRATWTEWDYVNGSFVLRQYGVQLSMSNLTITPSTECTTAVYDNGKWTMGSGYGYSICYTPSIVRASGYTLPDSDAYTSVQRVIARLPEFNYLETNGNYRTLELSGGKYYFVENADAANSERIHFIPLWYKDGDYTVSVTASRVWTPVGVITSTKNVSVTIDGTMYDDWYQG